jgi:hypothetical protein
MVTRERDILLAAISSEMARGDVYEAEIQAKDYHCLGAMTIVDQRVYVDPAPMVVETLFHELLHRRYPRWGEKRVNKTAAGLLATLTDAEKRRWYRRYQRTARKVTAPVRIE